MLSLFGYAKALMILPSLRSTDLNDPLQRKLHRQTESQTVDYTLCTASPIPFCAITVDHLYINNTMRSSILSGYLVYLIIGLVATIHQNSFSVDSFSQVSTITTTRVCSSHRIQANKESPTHRLQANKGSTNEYSIKRKIKSNTNRLITLPTAIGSSILTLSLLLQPIQPALASDYGSFTSEQKFVAESWRIIDQFYIDRTFNHQNWFQVRQDALKKKYKNMDEARAEVEKITGSLGDRYTRYLPPAKYDSIVNAATGSVFGVGVELAQDKEGMKVIASDVEPS